MFEAFSSIFAFLGGSAFRMIWGEISAHITAKREHANEMARMDKQGELEEKKHAREQEAIKTQHALGIETIRVQGEVDLEKLNAQAFAASTAEGMKPTGIKWVDAWNAMIRPAAASLALWLWFRSLYISNWAMQGRDWDMVCAILGWFFADRTLGKRGR